jgi:aminopeptidase N
MMHSLLGAEAFRKGMDLYFQRHDGQAVTTEDFVAALEAGSGRDLTQFRRWYRQVGTPLLKAREHWDDATGELTLELEQQVPGWAVPEAAGPLHIPLAIGLLDEEGREVPGGARLLELREERASVALGRHARRPRLSLLRDFSAPVRLERALDIEELAWLLAHDSDPYARWNAGQQLYTRSLLAAVEDLRRGRPAGLHPAVVAAWGAALADADQDPAFIALALQLPAYPTLEQELEPVSVEALVQALDLHRQGLATALKEQLFALYDRYQRELAARPYDRGPRSVGQRSLKNLCLGMLNELSDPESAAMALRQYREASCMSDAMGALLALTHSTEPEREEALEDFARRWVHDPVVMNAWFSVQAVSRREDTLERVHALLGHPAFELRNPNKVRALLVAFAMNNPARFHDRGGAAYDFYTERLLAVDALNAHMGAAMVRPIMSWKRHEPERAARLRAQLERLAAAAGLSANAAEIVTRSLS